MSSRIPRGIPSVTYCRVLPQGSGFAGQADIVSEGNTITVLDAGQPSSRHEVGQVLPFGISDEDACELTFGNQAGAGMGASLNPITACVSDAVSAIIFVVGSKETRKSHFMKKTVLPFVANELFQNIAEKDQQMASSIYKAQINISAFEIQDEIITDLLRPINRGLSLAVTAEEGVMVQGLQSEAVLEEMEMRRMLIDACENRASHTLPPGGSIDTTTAVFEFTLYQSEGGTMGPNGAGEGGRECHSRLLVIEIPSTDPLAHGGAVEVRQLQGPNLHKSLLTFLDVAKKLNTPSRAAIAPYRSSKLTHYLSELLGGNSIVVALGLLAHGEPLVSRKTLELMGALSNALHYPIGGKELTDVLQGLLGKYRSMLMQLQDELLNRTALNYGTAEQGLAFEKQLLQLQRELAENLKEKNSAIEDRERVYEMAELLKAKFETLLGEKLAQSEELAQSKEDNVVLAKTLMEKNLEFAAHKESTEKELFDLSSQLMAARNHIGELDASIEELHNNIAELTTQAEEKVREMSILREEIVSLNSQIEDRLRQIQVEKEKTIELGAELLTLVNRKEILQKEFEDLTLKHDAILLELSSKDATEAALKEKVDLLQKEVHHKEEQMFELTKHSVAVELEAKQAKLEADQLALQCREKLLLMAKPGTSNPDATISASKYEELQGTIKKSAKAVKDLERSLRRTQADLEETQKEKLLLAHDLGEVREKYREKLTSLLIHDGDEATAQYHHKHGKSHHRRNSRKGTGGKGVLSHANTAESSSSVHNNNNNNAEDAQAQEAAAQLSVPAPAPPAALSAAAALQHQLLDSYSEREATQNEALERALQQCASVKAAYRELYDKYRTTTEVVEECLPKGSAAKLKPLEEQLKFAEVDLSESEAFLDEMEGKERTALRDKFESEQAAGVLKNERLSLILATYQRNLELTEQKLVAAQQENIDLHIQIKQLVQNSSQLQHQLKDLSNSGKHSGMAVDPEMQVEGKSDVPSVSQQQQLQEQQQQQQQQYMTMYAALTEQIKELKDHIQLSAIAAASPGKMSKSHSAAPPDFAPESGEKASVSAAMSAQGSRTSLPPNSTHASEKLNPSVQPTPPATPPRSRRNSSVTASSSIAAGLVNKVATAVNTARGTPESTTKDAHYQVPPAEVDYSTLPNNPHGFRTMAEALQHIAALESNSHQALHAQLQKAQTKASELVVRNAALEEELKSYQAYMRDVVPQYKKQLQYMKQQLKVKASMHAIPAAPGSSGGAKGAEVDEFKLPQIK